MAVGEPVLNIVNSTMLDAGLTKIANAIRTKGGTSAQLAFPDGMADAIAAIESGGGEFAVASGTITYTSEVNLSKNPIVIEHGLPKKPCVFLAVHGFPATYPQYSLCYAYYANSVFGEMRSYNTGVMYVANAGSSDLYSNSGNKIVVANETTVTIAPTNTRVTVGYATAAGTLTWVALARN